MAHRVLCRGFNITEIRSLKRVIPVMSSRNYGPGDELGRGAGKGGGSGGSIRESGGAFGKREAAQEEEYFYKLQKEQLAKMHDHLHEEIEHHEEQLKHHQEAIDGIKKRLKDLGKVKK